MNIIQQAIDGEEVDEDLDFDPGAERLTQRLESTIYRGQLKLRQIELAGEAHRFKKFSDSIERQINTLTKIIQSEMTTAQDALTMWLLAKQLDIETTKLTRTMYKWKHLLEERARGVVGLAVLAASGVDANQLANTEVQVSGYLVPQLQPLHQTVNHALIKLTNRKWDTENVGHMYNENVVMALNRLNKELDLEMEKATLQGNPDERLGKRQKTDDEWAANPHLGNDADGPQSDAHY